MKVACIASSAFRHGNAGPHSTSAATVAVLPEADEIDIKIEAKDLRVDTFCSSGPAASPSTPLIPPSASRISPADWSCRQQDEKSQIKNRRKPALPLLLLSYRRGGGSRACFARFLICDLFILLRHDQSLGICVMRTAE